MWRCFWGDRAMNNTRSWGGMCGCWGPKEAPLYCCLSTMEAGKHFVPLLGMGANPWGGIRTPYFSYFSSLWLLIASVIQANHGASLSPPPRHLTGLMLACLLLWPEVCKSRDNLPAHKSDAHPTGLFWPLPSLDFKSEVEWNASGSYSTSNQGTNCGTNYYSRNDLC